MFEKGHLMNKGKKMPKKSYKDAVFCMCKMCIYDPESTGTWLMQVEACTSNGEGKNSVKCPLYDVRPLPRKTDVQS